MRTRFFPRIFIIACIGASLVYIAYFEEQVEAPWRAVFGRGRAGVPLGDRHRHGLATPTPFLDQNLTYRTSFPYSWTLVVASTTQTDTQWLNTSLTALVPPQGSLQVVRYVQNDMSAPFHPPANRGNEAMTYLSYILDFWDELPDIAVFMHGAMINWHTNALLNDSSPVLLQHLNQDKVVREGYVNLRCQWEPGCPGHIQPHNQTYDPSKEEQQLFLLAWQELFPAAAPDAAHVPELVAQPCCSQFAVSRDALRRVPQSTYRHLQTWLAETVIGSGYAGMIFEYVWQYLFLGAAISCPDPRICYCDTYGVCFDDDDGYNAYFRLRRERDCCERNGDVDGCLARLGEEMAELQRAAIARGRDPSIRAATVRAAREDWKWVPDDVTSCQSPFARDPLGAMDDEQRLIHDLVG